MELLGLSLSQVFATLGAAGAAVIVLYLLKLRRRQVAVPFVDLWREVVAEKQTTRLLSRLRRFLSLLLALLVVAALAFALGDPRLAGASAEGRTLVVLVDASASMQATDVATSRLDAAQGEVRRLAAAMGPADRMLVAQMDGSTTPLGPLTGDPRAIEDALGRIAAADVPARTDRALSFALDVLRGEPSPEIVVVGDGGLAPAGQEVAARLAAARVRLSWIRVGARGRNVAITAFAVRRYPLDKTQSEVLVELWNPTDREETIELTLLGDGAPLDVQRLVVHAGERLRRFFGEISGADRLLEARIAPATGPRDDLAVDDRAYARLPERRRARVLAVTRGNLYLDAALLLDEYLDVTSVAPEGYAGADGYDVAIFDDFVPATAPTADAIYLHPASPEGVAGPVAVDGVIEQPAFAEVDRRHPIVRWTALDDVNVAEALHVAPSQGDRVVAADPRGPLVLAGAHEGRRRVVFAFDVRRSDLPLRVAWPLLLLNAIDWFTEESTGFVSSYEAGETWHVPVAAGAERATIVEPDGTEHEVPVVEGRAVFRGRRAGFHTVRAGGREDAVASNLGPTDESLLAPPAALAIGAMTAGAPSEGRAGVRRELWIYLALLVAGIFVVEWLTYHRRWTV